MFAEKLNSWERKKLRWKNSTKSREIADNCYVDKRIQNS